ncbi:MAG: hypothetical protein IJX47_02270 [Clostridia bacterium]|nr:hypothetical protein [Clostridia bacterium]MBQ8382011.1 hypothetical protein [Clostridia bacterium]
MRIFIFENGLKKAPTEYSQYLVYPYSAEYSHDTALGAASVTLRNMEREETFAPGTVVMIGDGYWTDNTLDQWVIVDTARGTNHANRKHTHTLYLCDITKLLEREVIGNKTFTRSMALDTISDKLIKVSATVTDTHQDYVGKNGTDTAFYYILPSSLLSPMPFVTYEREKFSDIFVNRDEFESINECWMKIWHNGKLFHEWSYNFLALQATQVDSNGVKTTSGSVAMYPLDWYDNGFGDESVTIDTEGTVEVECAVKIYLNEISQYQQYNTRSIRWFVYVTGSDDNQLSKKQISLLNACYILGAIAREGRLIDKLYIQPVGEVATTAMNAEIVDIDLSGMTLREAIDTVAGVGGCFCRYKLWYNSDDGRFDHQVKIYPISSGEVASVSAMGAPVLRKMNDSIEGACSAMDSTVNNLVCASDSGVSAEPTSKAWMSLRSEEVRVTEESAEAQTSNAIYRVDKLEVAYETGTSYGTYTADITKYLYEKTEYDLLSSYAPAYPKSKSYALYYERGKNSISGLSFEIEHAFSQLFVSPAIVNICNAEFGTSFSDLGFSGDGILEYPKLRFRITYVPIVNTRVKQTKPDAADNAVSNVIVYNQSADYVDSNRYGRNIAGAADRGGQPGKTVSYKAKVSTAIPSPGTLYPDDPEYTISKVTVERGKDVKTVQLDLARHFNRMNPFIGIDSAPRLFEISERQYVDRNVIYEDFCIIGDVVTGGSASMITTEGLQGFAGAISSVSAIGDDTPEIAVVQGSSEYGTPTKCILPISSFGLGRSLTFTFGYKDNYAAGDKVNVTSAAGALYSLKEAVPYADVFGEFETLSLSIYAKQGTDGIDPDKLPEYHDGAISGGKMLFDTNELQSDIVVYKDSRECIKFTYQIHFVTNKSWIISPGMAEDFRMITRKSSILTKKVCLYRLSYELSRIDTVIDLSRATAESFTTHSGAATGIPLTVSATSKEDKSVVIDPEVTGTYREYNKFSGTGKAWAVAYEDGKLLFGSNEPITASKFLPNINFSFRHTVE